MTRNIYKPPQFIIAGAPKCGTTTVSRHLARHPDIFIPESETNFYVFYKRKEDFRAKQIHNVKSLEDYRLLYTFNNTFQHTMIGEKSVSYIYREWSDFVIRNIKEVHPDPDELKLIFILRQPVDRMFSQYVFNLNFDEKLPFEKAIYQYETRKAQNWIPAYDYFGASYYAESILSYKQHFNRVGIFFFDDLVEDFPGFIKELTDFLEVDFELLPKGINQIYNIGGIPNNLLLKMFKSIGTTKFLKGLKDTTRGQYIRNAVKKRFYTKPELSTELKMELTKAFEEDILLLQKIANRDLTHWIKTD